MKSVQALAARAAEIHHGMSPWDDDGTGSQRVQAARQAAREAGVPSAGMAVAVRQIVAQWDATELAAAAARNQELAAERTKKAAEEAARREAENRLTDHQRAQRDAEAYMAACDAGADDDVRHRMHTALSRAAKDAVLRIVMARSFA